MVQWTVSGILLLCFWFVSQKQVHLLAYDHQVALAISCDLTVDAGPDTSVCYPSGLIGLHGTIEGNDIFFQWTPSNGLNNPFILNPIANVTGPITYTLTAYASDSNNPNLIVNGDFSQGNTGFSTDYNYVADLPAVQNEMVPAGTYTVINNPNLVHAGFIACNDHTGGGNMMVLNGAPSFQNVWCQTIPVTQNTFYNVSAWVASVNSTSPAQLRFSINGTQIGSIVYATPIPCLWRPFNATWNSGNNTTAVICILNLNTASNGNDFAIDDISMVGLCSVSDAVEITLYQETAPEPEIDGPSFLCSGESGTYVADFPPDPPILSYAWSVPSGATILSGQGTPQVTVRWDNPQTADLCLMIETRCDMNEGCFEVTVGDVPELPLISGPGLLCFGEIANLYTQEINPNDLYDWILPSGVSIVSGNGTNEIEIQGTIAGEVEICLDVTNDCGTTENCTFLTLLANHVTSFDTILCLGTTILINNHPYGNGIWSGTEIFTAKDGCDSTVNITITEATSLEFMFTQYLCPGDSVFLQGAFQNQAGTYIDSFTTISNCDSIVMTEVIVTPFDTTWIVSTTCDPASAGTTITSYSQGNCDSTVITQVILLASDTTLINLFSCLPVDTGLTIQLLTNLAGCDSLVVTNTDLLRTDTTLLFQTSCDPLAAGVSMDTLNNIAGCDSLVITTVSFLLSDTTLINSLTCMYSDTGTISALYINSKGCDSLVISSKQYAGSDTLYITANTCIPANAGLIVSQLTNQSGCDSIVIIDVTLLASDTIYLSDSSCDPLDTGDVSQHLINIAGCDSLVVTTTSLIPVDVCQLNVNISVQQPNCYGDSAFVTIDILTGLGPFTLTWIHLDEMGTFDYPSIGLYSFPFIIQGTSQIILTSANGLQIIDTIYVNALSAILVGLQVQGNYSGFGVPCNGDTTGEIKMNVLSGGTSPYSFVWSHGDNTQDLSNLKAGTYVVTVTDSHGCKASSSIEIKQPEGLMYTFSWSGITCFNRHDGYGGLIDSSGGVFPWSSSFDGQSFLPQLTYQNLSSGFHNLDILDQNGCSSHLQFFISEPDAWSVDLGADTTVDVGSTIELLSVISGLPSGLVHYHWSDNTCEDCSSRSVTINAKSDYTVTATDDNGCSSVSAVTINVIVDHNLFIPTVFTPNGDDVNDRFLISSITGLETIEALRIFDRWGNEVFAQIDFHPNDASVSWDGLFNGRPVNVGVYVYTLTITYRDGQREQKFGDITLIR